MKKLIFVFLLYSLSILYSDELELWSQAAILIDGETDQILYQKNPNKLVAPASMTKVVTLFIVYEYISQGGHKDEYVTVSKNADWRNLPRDSSLMFIEEGQSVTLLELMKGLAIPSGNDAAIAIAEHISGSVPAFIEFMNRRVTELGFRSMKFIDASGFDDNNSITVLEFAQFVAIFYEKYPEAIEELFSLKEFSYPKIKNGETSIGLVTQFNHNPMVGYFPGCDGLKTGFIYKSGLNISLSAKRNGRRVYAVLSGGSTCRSRRKSWKCNFYSKWINLYISNNSQ
ncbi:MAG: hypothetical protein B6229_03975 [Spirochaetaceae bacterium 4572_7]|nr:MAG: hypothetical protein B6229_03975 [Spirochaetaceae bacterium 4572_7]